MLSDKEKEYSKRYRETHKEQIKKYKEIHNPYYINKGE